MKQHLGTILEKAVRQSGYPISKLAKRIGYTRQHIYNLFTQKHIDFDLLDKIGKVIHYNFAEDVKQLKKYTMQHSEFDISVKEPTMQFDTSFKEKYYKLLEEYATLLKENATLLKKLIKN